MFLKFSHSSHVSTTSVGVPLPLLSHHHGPTETLRAQRVVDHHKPARGFAHSFPSVQTLQRPQQLQSGSC